MADKKLAKQKFRLDKQIAKHADERMKFTLVSDSLGVVDFDVAVGDLFENLTLIYLDEAIKKNMTMGKMYEYSASAFAGACEPVPMFLFMAGIDPMSDDLFNTDPEGKYVRNMCYAFPVDKLTEWMVEKKPKTSNVEAESFIMDKDADISDLIEMIEEGEMTPDTIRDWIISHGGRQLGKDEVL